MLSSNLFNSRNLLLFVALALILAIFAALIIYATVVRSDATTADAATGLPPEEAVPIATEWASDSIYGGPGFGGLIGKPRGVAGAIITLNEAVEIDTGYSIDPNTQQWLYRENLVWLVIFDGEVNGRRQISEKLESDSAKYSQVLVIMDAETGLLISRTAVVSGQERKPAGLDDLMRFMPEIAEKDSRQSEAAILPPEKAVPLALQRARALGSIGAGFGRLIGEPDAVTGAVMTLEQAKVIRSGAPIDSNFQPWRSKDDLVWFMLFEGEIDKTCNAPGCSHIVGPNPQNPDRRLDELEYNQVLVMIYAATGAPIIRAPYPVGEELSTQGLDDLSQFLGSK